MDDVFSFIPNTTFEEKVNGCLNRYREGETYHCHPGEQSDELRKLARNWARKKKVQIVGYAGRGGPMLTIGMGGKPAEKPGA